MEQVGPSHHRAAVLGVHDLLSRVNRVDYIPAGTSGKHKERIIGLDCQRQVIPSWTGYERFPLSDGKIRFNLFRLAIHLDLTHGRNFSKEPHGFADEVK